MSPPPYSSNSENPNPKKSTATDTTRHGTDTAYSKEITPHTIIDTTKASHSYKLSVTEKLLLKQMGYASAYPSNKLDTPLLDSRYFNLISNQTTNKSMLRNKENAYRLGRLAIIEGRHANVYRHALPSTTPETVVLRERASTKLSEFLTYTTYQLHTLYPYGNIQSNNNTNASLKTNSKQASTNDSAFQPSVHCLSITAFRLHVSALLPSDYWLGIAAFGPTSHHNNQIYNQAHNIPQNLAMASTTHIHPKSHTSYKKEEKTKTTNPTTHCHPDSGCRQWWWPAAVGVQRIPAKKREGDMERWLTKSKPKNTKARMCLSSRQPRTTRRKKTGTGRLPPSSPAMKDRRGWLLVVAAAAQGRRLGFVHL
ncbi:hypothetical protein LXL04_037818 [Taraxacum kok-saghyz]